VVFSSVFRVAPTGILTAGSASALDTYNGICDASTVALLDADHFIIASDESESDLYFYEFKNKSMQPPFELDDFLGHPESEADLEGVTRIGDP